MRVARWRGVTTPALTLLDNLLFCVMKQTITLSFITPRVSAGVLACPTAALVQHLLTLFRFLSTIIALHQAAGGGCKKLFRKIGNRSSEFYPDLNEVRRDASYIYEEFVETQGTDVKMYTYVEFVCALAGVHLQGCSRLMYRSLALQCWS
jgi:hypothetical protein